MGNPDPNVNKARMWYYVPKRTGVMSTTRKTIVALLYSTAIFISAGRAVHGQCYSVTDVGSLGGLRTYLNDLNNLGQVVGTSSLPGSTFPQHPFLWLPKPAYGLPAGINDLDLGRSGQTSSGAFAINDLGQVVGYTGDPDSPEMTLWLPEPAYDLPAGMNNLGRINGAPTRPFDINNRGEIVGEGYDPSGHSEFCFAFLWLPAAAYGLPPGMNRLLGFSVATAINNHGQIVGQGPGFHASLWTNGKVLDLGTLPPSWSRSKAYGINDLGEVVGSSGESASERAFIWLPEAAYGLPAGMSMLESTVDQSRIRPPGARAWDINSFGQAVGQEAGDLPNGALWLNGRLVLLDDRVRKDFESSLLYARAINERGQILTRGGLLTPMTGDFDNDCRTDLIDYEMFQPCFAGPSLFVHPSCGRFDLNADRIVDLGDFSLFRVAFRPPRPPSRRKLLSR